MIFLDRSKVRPPAKWAEGVQKAFPDFAAFVARAAAFEALPLSDPVRKGGFRAYDGSCPVQTLPKKTKKGTECEFKAIWGRCKEALAEMSHRKCSYCESPIEGKRTAAVEHYRPKSIFPSVAYEWDNYFLGCGGCNGAKLDKWPEDGRSYIRPDAGEPSIHFLFLEDGSMMPALEGGEEELTVADLDMDRKWLRGHRATLIRKALEDLRGFLAEEEIPTEVRARLARDFIARHQDPKLPYVAAVSQCLRRAWNEAFPGVAL